MPCFFFNVLYGCKRLVNHDRDHLHYIIKYYWYTNKCLVVLLADAAVVLDFILTPTGADVASKNQRYPLPLPFYEHTIHICMLTSSSIW